MLDLRNVATRHDLIQDPLQLTGQETLLVSDFTTG